jgi:hypothetical protein
MTIDGFPVRALKDLPSPMPTLRQMIAEGAHADDELFSNDERGHTSRYPSTSPLKEQK